MQDSHETISVSESPAAKPAPRRQRQAALPALAQFRDSTVRISEYVRASVPLRTLLFVLPVVLIPPLAFDLSPLAMVLVPIGLLWLAVASAVFTTLMIDGTRDRRLVAISERLDQVAKQVEKTDDANHVNERLDALTAEIYALAQAIGNAERAGRSGRSLRSVDYDEVAGAPTQLFNSRRTVRPKHNDKRRRDERWR